MTPRRRPSRRDLLRTGAALGAGAALPGCRGARAIEGRIVDSDVAVGHRLRDGAFGGAPAATERVPVLIAGGGVAGLSAAWRLRRAGFDDFALLELGDGPGGTARAGETKGFRHPWGAHYLPAPQAHQRALCAFLEDAGLSEGFDDRGRMRVPATALVRAPQERLYTVGAWDEGLWPGAGASPRDRDELERFGARLLELNAPDGAGRRPFDLPLSRCNATLRELDELDAATWAAREGLDGERIRWYLEFATRDDYGASLPGTSAWALLHYFTSRTTPGTRESGEYMTWPEGNAFLVEHLADGLGERVRTRTAVLEVRPGDAEVEVDAVDLASGAIRTFRAEHLVLALPQFVVARVLRDDPARDARARFRYSPWVVANLHLDGRPSSRGFPDAWDNVVMASDALGWIDAGHQLDRATNETVWTWYLPLTDADERASRARMLARSWEEWRDLVLADVRYAVPEIDEHVTRVDVWRWGHAMVRPVPGFLWGDDRRRAAASLGRVHFAHSDVAGLPIFEEAHACGARAAEACFGGLGVSSPSLFGE